jgi:hypothetical protein
MRAIDCSDRDKLLAESARRKPNLRLRQASKCLGTAIGLEQITVPVTLTGRTKITGLGS